MKARKKPIEIDFIKYTGDNFEEIEKELNVKYRPIEQDYLLATPHLLIGADGSVVRIQPGDYIIKGIAGEIYPCDAIIFEATYDIASKEKSSNDIANLIPDVKSKINPGQAVTFNGEEYIFIHEEYIDPIDRLHQQFYGRIHLANKDKHTYVHYDYPSLEAKNFISWSDAQERQVKNLYVKEQKHDG
jgi:hypothetical protein